jgi:hypothetical protein
VNDSTFLRDLYTTARAARDKYDYNEKVRRLKQEMVRQANLGMMELNIMNYDLEHIDFVKLLAALSNDPDTRNVRRIVHPGDRTTGIGLTLSWQPEYGRVFPAKATKGD